MAKTYTEQLDDVQDAIVKVQQGQSYSIAGRSLSRADLQTLYDRESYLLGRISRENRGGGIRVRGVTPV